MNQKSLEDIKKNMDSLSTKELSSIYEDRNRNVYSEEGYEAIRQILVERGEKNIPLEPAKSEHDKSESKSSGEERNKTNGIKNTLLTVIGTIVVIFVLFIICRDSMKNSSSSITPSTETSKKAITAYVTMSLATITIKNGDNFDWPSVELFINGWDESGVLGSYEYKHGTVQNGETITIPLIMFTKDEKRFQPMTMAVKKLVVYVPDYGARLYEY